MAALNFYQGPSPKMCAPLEGKITTFGRGRHNDIVIPSNKLARHQFSIELIDGTWILRDMSGRGTIVDNMLRSEIELKDGMEIAISHWRAIFVAH